jgi:apolipoprotein N-acyltransferase
MLTNLAALNAWRAKRKTILSFSWLALAAIPYLFGSAQLAHHVPKSNRAHQRVNVALVQTDLLPSEKAPHAGRAEEFVSPFAQWQRILDGLTKHHAPHWDLIVLPEAAVAYQSDMTLFPFDAVRVLLMQALGPDIEKDFPDFSIPFAEKHVLSSGPMLCVSNLFWCQTLANHFKAELIAGFDHTDKTSQKNYNSAFYLKPQASSCGRYDKRVLLPLAEYLPSECLRTLTKNYGIFDYFTRGQRAIVMGNKIPFSPSICYEETFPEIMREGKIKGARLFVNITNDNYFPNSNLHEQHLFHARLRAAENGIPLIRSCNSGVSAAIDSFGRIVARSEELKENFNSKEGVLSCGLNPYCFSTLYTFWGDKAIVGFSMLSCLCFLFKKLFTKRLLTNESS